MGATERIAELMKSMQEREVREVLDFAEFLIAKRERDKTDAFTVFEKHAGLWSGKFNREDAYVDREVLR
ncbi:MAG: DUF2281 domain-containing protein [Betaproteobacteria bacterium]